MLTIFHSLVFIAVKRYFIVDRDIRLVESHDCRFNLKILLYTVHLTRGKHGHTDNFGKRVSEGC